MEILEGVFLEGKGAWASPFREPFGQFQENIYHSSEEAKLYVKAIYLSQKLNNKLWP
jgi:hypothetical protein